MVENTKDAAQRLCDCSECEWADTCKFKDRYQRLPREIYKGVLSLCPKIRNEHF